MTHSSERYESEATPLFSALHKISADQYTRLIKRRTPRILTLISDPNTNFENFLLLPPPGSVVLYVSEDPDEISKLETAYLTTDLRLLMGMASDFEQQLQLEPPSLSKAAEQIIEAPVYFDLRYGGKTLATTIALINGSTIGSILLPYNGGQLRDEDFSIIEYYRSEPPAGYDYLLIKCPPHLSDIEQKAVDAVPADQLELNIGSSITPAFPVDMVKEVARAINRAIDRAVNGRMAGPGPTRELYRHALELTLTPATIEALGPAPSAVELLSLRRQLFNDPRFQRS